MALMTVRKLHVANRLTDISLSIAAGEMLGIIGPNGSGKSSLLHSLAGLLKYQGAIEFMGQDLARMGPRHRARGIGLMPQSCSSAWSLDVEEIVALGRLPWDDRDDKVISAAMEQARIMALRRRSIGDLSGGEQARVWLARVFAGQPNLLLADEPLASLDLLHQRGVLQSLRSYAGAERSVALAIHDLGLAARYCDRLCLMQQGTLFALGTPAQVLTEENLSTVFGVPVLVDLNARTPMIALK